MKCEYCGKEFFGRRRKYCSVGCSRSVDKDRKRMQYVGKREKVCRQCGVELPKNKTRFCSDRCASRYHAIRDGRCFSHGELTKTCPICGKSFTTNKSRKLTCSQACSKKYHYRDTRLKGRVVDRDINLRTLFDRDHGQCQICGLMVDWSDKQMRIDGRTTYGMMYPSIDHIRPISLGGVHSWENVQLAHMGCNTRKNNKYVG